MRDFPPVRFWFDVRDAFRAGIPLRRPLWLLPLRLLSAGLLKFAEWQFDVINPGLR